MHCIMLGCDIPTCTCTCTCTYIHTYIQIYVHDNIKFHYLRSLVLDCVDDEALHTLCSGKLKLSFLDLSHSGITDKRYI